MVVKKLVVVKELAVSPLIGNVVVCQSGTLAVLDCYPLASTAKSTGRKMTIERMFVFFKSRPFSKS